VHFGVNPGPFVSQGVTFLWGVGQKLRKLWVAIEDTDTLDDIPVVKFIILTCNLDFLPYKPRKPIWEFLIDDLIGFLRT
jgi:hypothetical protein